MGGVAVLHPQGCLNHHHHHHHDNLFSTPVKSRRTHKSSPNVTRSEGRKRSPPAGVRKNKTTAEMLTDPPQAAVKNLVMERVKILKRGEALDDDSSTILKEMNVIDDRKVSGDSAGGRRVLQAKKKSEKDKRSLSISNPRIEESKYDDFTLSSTNRLGPEPEMVPKQMKKNMAEFFFAGSAFVDSPPPSSVPLPCFFSKNHIAAMKEDPSTGLQRILGLSLSEF